MRTRKVVRNVVIDVIEKGRSTASEWNVQIRMRFEEEVAARRRPGPKRHRTVRIKGPRQKYTDNT